MSSADHDLQTVFRVQKTVFEMLRDRGFVVQQADLAMDFPAFKERYSAQPTHVRESMDILVCHRDDSADRMRVVFNQQEKTTAKQLQQFGKDNAADNIRRGIFISRVKVKDQARRVIESLNATTDSRIEVFEEAELVVNITRHILVPQHIKLTMEQKVELFKRYRININDTTSLPRLLKRDPVSRYYGFEQGDVVKIVRRSETAGRYISYRIVM